jgi:hypothetical protein
LRYKIGGRKGREGKGREGESKFKEGSKEGSKKGSKKEREERQS